MAADMLRLRVVLDLADRALAPLKRITQGSKATAQALSATRKELRDLNAQQGAIDRMRGLQQQLAATGQQTKVATVMLAQLRQETPATAAEQRKLAQQIATAEKELQRLNATSDTQRQRLIAVRRAMKEMGIGNVTEAEARLRSQIDATTRSVERQQAQLSRLAKIRETTARQGMKAGLVVGAGVAMQAAGRKGVDTSMTPIKAFSEAEDASTGLKVALMLKDGSVAPAFEKIKVLADELGNKLPGTTADYQRMMTMLVRQGIPAEKILGGVGSASAYLAVQLKKAPEAAAEFAAKMQDATRTADSDMMALMDTIQRAYYLGVDDNNMLQGFSKLSPALSILRKEGAAAAKELAPLLVMSDQAGMAGEAAGNAYRKIFQAAMGDKKIKKANKELQGTGVTLDFTDGKGEFGGLDKMFKQLQQLKGVNTQRRLAALKDAFGDDAETLQALTLMIEKGADGYQEVVARMQTQADLQRRVSEQLGTLRNLWDAASGTATNALATIGESIAPEIKSLTTWLGNASQGIGEFSKAHPTLVKWLALTALGLSGILLVAGTLLIPIGLLAGKFILMRYLVSTLGVKLFGLGSGMSLLSKFGAMAGRAFSVLSPILTAAGSAIVRLGALMLTNPIGIALTLIAVAAFMVWRNWDGIKGGLIAIWETLSGAVSGWWNSISSGGQAAWQYVVDLKSRFLQAGADLMAGLTDGITSRLAAVRDTIAGAADSVAQWFRDRLGIKSPSRVFMEAGGFISEGTALGITGRQDLVRRAALAMAGTAVASASMAADGLGSDAQPLVLAQRPVMAARQAGAGGSAAAAPASSHQITINATPGMDPQAIARAVSAELDRRDRAARSRVLSSMSDID